MSRKSSITFVCENEPNVHCYDLVFAPAKPASVPWAIGGDEARQEIEAAHHEAIEETTQFLEKEATYTRRGRKGVRQEDAFAQ